MNNLYKVHQAKKSASFILILALLLTGFLLNSSNAENCKESIALTAAVQGDTVTLIFSNTANENIDYNLFTLEDPPRLVIDFREAIFDKTDVNQIIRESGYSQLRSLNHDDKSRIVLDTDYNTLPPFTQQEEGHRLIISLKQAAPGSTKNNHQENNESKKSLPFKTA